MTSLCEAACQVLTTADAGEKCRLTHHWATQWRSGAMGSVGRGHPPDRPARPERPELLPFKAMPRRSYGGDAGRISLIHALAHIELNAVDLAWDMVARFVAWDMPRRFYDDWVRVAEDEARHFEMLEGLLNRLGATYGDRPAHDGLWQAAEKTADDLMARLAVVPMTLEARGLDTTPATMAKLSKNGDDMTPPALEIIFNDEIHHVAAGVRWFSFLAERAGDHGARAFHRIMAERYPAGLKAPFNHEARARALYPRDWYEPLAR